VYILPLIGYLQLSISSISKFPLPDPPLFGDPLLLPLDLDLGDFLYLSYPSEKGDFDLSLRLALFPSLDEALCPPFSPLDRADLLPLLLDRDPSVGEPTESGLPPSDFSGRSLLYLDLALKDIGLRVRYSPARP